MLYLYMAKALNAFPHLKRYCHGVHSSAMSDEQLHALPARDSHVKEIMYGPDHNLEEHFNALDARDWRDAAGRRALLLADAGRLPAPIAAGIQMLMEPVPADAAHAEWVHTPGFDDNPVFSFAGAAWLALYNLGAASALRERWDLGAPAARLCGTSSGALVAAANALGSPLSDSVVRCFEQWVECNEHVMGPWSQMDRIVGEGLVSLTPPHAHRAVSHRLKVALASSIAPIQHAADCAAAGAAADVKAAGGGQLHDHPAPQAVGLVGLDAYWGPQVLPYRVHATSFPSLSALFAAVRASCFLPCYSGAYAKLPRHALHMQHPTVHQEHEASVQCACTGLGDDGRDGSQADVGGRAAAWWHAAGGGVGVRQLLAPCSRREVHACFDGAMTDNIPRWHGDEEFSLLKLVAERAAGTSFRAPPSTPEAACPIAAEGVGTRGARSRSRSVSRLDVSAVETDFHAPDEAETHEAESEESPAAAMTVPLVVRQRPWMDGAGSPGGGGPPPAAAVPPLAADLRPGVCGVRPSALQADNAGGCLRWTSGAVALRSGYVFDPRTDGLTVTISPNAGAGTISPPCCQADPAPQRAGSPLPRREQRPVSFDVAGGIGVGGWAGVHAVFPCPASVWWETFFAGRAHAQAWMAQQGYPPRPRGQGKPTQ